MKLRLLFIVILLCIAGGASADDADRLIADFDRKTDVASANKFFEFLDRREFTDSKIVFSNAVHADSLRQQTWYWAAEWYYDCQNYSLARDYAKRALPLMRWPNLDKSCCLNLLGIIHVRLGDFKTAVEYAKRCVDIDIRLNDPDRVSSSLNTLAGAYMAANQPQDAERYILRGLEYAERAGNPSRKAVLLGMASEIYYKLGDYSKSVDYADRAYRLDSIGGREAKMAVRLSQKGTALVGLKKYAEAEQVLLKAIAGLRASGNVHSLAIDLNQLGFLMLRQDREREAVGYFSQAASLFGKMGDLYNLVNSHKGLYESYWLINPDSARIELEHFNALRDSLYSTATADALARYKTEFDTDRLREEVEQIHSARHRDIVVGVCVLAVVVLAAVAIHRRRMRRYRAEMLALIRDVESLYGTPEPEKAPEQAGEVPLNLETTRRFAQVLEKEQELMEDERAVEELQHMQKTTESICAWLEAHPESLPKARRFAEYYIPTTLKLLHTYNDVQSQQGENAEAIRRDIAGILHTLNQAYDNLYDKLLSDVALDVSSEIAALQGMLANDGLAGEGLR